MPLTVIILTYNSEASLEKVILSCHEIASRILVVDSYSDDSTPKIAQSHGCEFVQHPFENYARQRNWAQTYAALDKGEWVLHLDSDEVLSEELRESMKAALEKDTPETEGFLVRRLSYFLGRPIRYGHINPSWHLRLFRAECGQCEDRLYDQHYIVKGKTERLRGELLDLQITTLERWTQAHNRWSSAEMLEVLQRVEAEERESEGQLKASLTGDIRMKKRWLKNNIWYRLPLMSRSFLFFAYSYFFRLGFLDGKEGAIYHVLQSFWFRFLVDAKIYEARQIAFQNGGGRMSENVALPIAPESKK